MEYQKQSALSGAQKTAPTGLRQPIYPYSAEYIPKSKSELKSMQEALHENEERLIAKEQFLLAKEIAINNKHYQTLVHYEKSLNKQPDLVKSFTDQMKLDNKFETIESGNENIMDDIRSLKRDLMKVLRKKTIQTFLSKLSE